VDDATLLTGELVANAVRHGLAPIDLEVSDLGQRVRVAVRDNGPGLPALREPLPDEPSGRGIRLVAAVALAWGVEHGDDAHGDGRKTVWAELATYREPAP
jgi:anti-sigma regulatory factor (Ser/Thr protein kinase)